MPSVKRGGPSELQVALDNRAFEIQLFWQRSNYFLVLMTALGIGVFTIENEIYALFISIFATITSWYWYKTNLGSKFWQESWEVEVVELSKENSIRSFEKPTGDIIEQVRKSLEQAWISSGKGPVRRLIDKQILKKPSVSHYMIMLSLTSVLLWAVVSLTQGLDLLKRDEAIPKGVIDQDYNPALATPKASDIGSRREVSGSVAKDDQEPPVPANASPQGPTTEVESAAATGTEGND